MEKKRRRYPESFKKETVVQIEIDAAETGRNYAVSTAVVGDAPGCARAFGIEACRVETIEELGTALATACSADCPWLIEMAVSLPWPV